MESLDPEESFGREPRLPTDHSPKCPDRDAGAASCPGDLSRSLSGSEQSADSPIDATTPPATTGTPNELDHPLHHGPGRPRSQRSEATRVRTEVDQIVKIQGPIPQLASGDPEHGGDPARPEPKNGGEPAGSVVTHDGTGSSPHQSEATPLGSLGFTAAPRYREDEVWSVVGNDLPACASALVYRDVGDDVGEIGGDRGPDDGVGVRPALVEINHGYLGGPTSCRRRRRR